jgi:hypothetical protein
MLLLDLPSTAPSNHSPPSSIPSDPPSSEPSFSTKPSIQASSKLFQQPSSMPYLEPCSKPSQQPFYEPSSPTTALNKAEKMVSDRYPLLGLLWSLLRRRSLLWCLLQCLLYFRRCHRPNPLLLPCSHTHRNLPASWKSGRRSWSRFLPTVPILSDPTTTPQGVAYRWLRNDDPLPNGPCTYATVEQRYALATRWQLSIIRLLETAGPTTKPIWLTGSG